jgi:retinol-binding protein 3
MCSQTSPRRWPTQYRPITHKDWEGTGGTPDVAAPATDALRLAYRAALQRVAAVTRDAAQKAEIEAALAAKK